MVFSQFVCMTQSFMAPSNFKRSRIMAPGCAAVLVCFAVADTLAVALRVRMRML